MTFCQITAKLATSDVETLWADFTKSHSPSPANLEMWDAMLKLRTLVRLSRGYVEEVQPAV